jgi:general secretion pathway protein A
LKQRIALRARLEPLDWEETSGYIIRRLQMAGANTQAETIFPPETIAEIYRQSRGIPRLINTICENALITGYARQLRRVPVDIIDEVAKDFRLNSTNWSRGDNAMNHDDHGEGWPANNKHLPLHGYAPGRRAREEAPSATTVPGAGKHEPYI